MIENGLAAAFQVERVRAGSDRDRLFALDLAENILAKAGTASASPKTFIGVPHIGNVELGTAKGCLIECSENIHLVTFQDYLTSLLAWGFNHLWCDALNARQYTYWLLCHADMSFRTPRFLDVLIEELESHSLDALHVSVPIKDDRGLTSTGIGNGDDPWKRVRRLTTTELQQLPLTFGLDDVVQVMRKTGNVPANPVFCPNTGVLLVKFGDWSWDFPGFTIQDKLETEVTPQGQVVRVPRVIPEDWWFGHWTQSQGLKVGGTRAVKINHHHSSASFVNDFAWGDVRDECYCKDTAHQ